MTNSSESEAFNVTQTCDRLGGISRKTFYDLKNAGELKTFKIGSRTMVSGSAIAAFIRKREAVA